MQTYLYYEKIHFDIHNFIQCFYVNNRSIRFLMVKLKKFFILNDKFKKFNNLN